MAAIFPPDHLHGKHLKMWYREQTRRLIGTAYLPAAWTDRPGLETEPAILRLIPGRTYEKWDMKDELLTWVRMLPKDARSWPLAWRHRDE